MDYRAANIDPADYDDGGVLAYEYARRDQDCLADALGEGIAELKAPLIAALEARQALKGAKSAAECIRLADDDASATQALMVALERALHHNADEYAKRYADEFQEIIETAKAEDRAQIEADARLDAWKHGDAA